MNLCPRCEVWLPVGHVHSKAECDEHIRNSRIIRRNAAVWRRKYAVEPRIEQAVMDMEVERWE